MQEALLPYEWPGSYFYGDEELEQIRRVIESRSPYRFFGHAPAKTTDRVEEYFKKRLSRKHALLVNSGSAALFIAMTAADIGPGDEVCIPGYMWVACISAVVRTGAIPRLVEVDDTFTMSPSDLKNKINERTKAVLLVHMSGAAGHVDEITSICKEKKIVLIEDCAQANGASYHGRPVGSFGDLAIFSFQYNKNITAGEGGMVVCNDDELAARAWAIHEQGYAKNDAGVVDWYAGPVQTWGVCSHMSEISGAILLAQVEKLDTITSMMRERNHALYQALATVPGVTVRRVLDPAGDSGPFVLFSFATADICNKMVAITRERGVRPGAQGNANICLHDWGLHIYYHNTALTLKKSMNSKGRPWTDPLNSFAANIDYNKGALPYTDDLVSRSVLLTVPPILDFDTIRKIVAIYQQAALELGLK